MAPVEAVMRERKAMQHVWDRIQAKEGEDVTITLTPQERAFLFTTATFASEYPYFLIEFSPEQEQDVKSQLAALAAKLT